MVWAFWKREEMDETLKDGVRFLKGRECVSSKEEVI